MKNILCLFFFTFVQCMLVHGMVYAEERVHALAMHGEPLYDKDFTHLSYANPQAPQGGTIRHAVIGSYDNLHPFIIKGRAAQGWHHTQESLMARSWDEPFTLYGLLAQEVSLAEDYSTITFYLHPQARWHDGSSVTAEDVVFSWESLRDDGRPNFRNYYQRVLQVDVVNSRQVRFTFVRNEDESYDRELPLIMALMPILSAKHWEERDFSQTTLVPPLGSGPYRVGRFETGRFIEYERVHDYWGEDLPVRKGHNNFHRIRYTYFRDQNVAFEGFSAHHFDVWRESDPVRWSTEYERLERGEEIVRRIFSHRRPQPVWALSFNIRRELFRDKRVRQALFLVLERETINRLLFHNSYKLIESYYPHSDFVAPEEMDEETRTILQSLGVDWEQETFSLPLTQLFYKGDQSSTRRRLRKALTLLQQAGWSLSRGVLRNRQGDRFAFEILLRDPREERIALFFTRHLRRLGIQASVRTVESAQYQERLTNFDFDMTTVRWYSTLSPGNEQLYYFGSDAAHTPGSRNYPGIESGLVDTLVRSLSQVKTYSALITRVRALDRVLLSGFYVIPLFYVEGDRIAFSTNLGFPEETSLYGPVFETWWYK